jgi:hypothetical protein
VRRTPVTDRLKKFEGDTLENAVKFTWFEIRGEFDEQLDARAVIADWSRQASN